MIGPSFFLEQFLGLVMGEIWDCSKGKIITAYKNYKNSTEEEKSFETRMYTAIVDAFCYYANVTPQNARPEIMDFIYTTAEVYFNESQRKQDDTPATLLDALHSLDSKFGDTTLFKNYKNKEKKDDAKIEMVAKYLQKYIVKDDKFKDEYINEVLTRLLRIGQRIEKMQLEQQLFPEQIIAAVKESEHDINSTTIEQAAMLREEIHRSPLYQIIKTESVNFENNTKLEYVEKWNERLFLHRRPEDEELTLQNTYIPTLFNIIEPESEKTNIPQDTLNKKLYQFINHGKSLLLIGPPGIGKTSIVCYLADKYKSDPNVIILRFSDWSEEEWVDLAYKTHGSLLAKAITHRLGYTEKNLKNKLLILDGFDEIKYYSNGNDLLKSFLLQIRNIRGLRVLITSRDNYINLDEVKFQQVIKLCPFNVTKIMQYCKKILPTIEIEDENILFIDKEVYGIPVILYMAIVSGIDITQNSNRCNAYNKIFSYEGGIFDRFATITTEGYDNASTHDISYEKEAFINILCKTAFTMFSVSHDNLITIEQYQEIIDAEGQKVINKTALWYEFPIDNLYEKNNRLQFVHKSIYEYFVAENIYYQLLKLFRSTDNKIQNDAFSIIADLLCANIFEDDIIEFMRYRIRNSELNTLEIFKQLKYLLYTLLNCGPTNFITNDGCEKPPFHLENYGKFLCNINIIFHNLLVLIHCWTTTKNFDAPLSGMELLLNMQKYKYDPLPNVILSYLRHIDEPNGLDLSYIGFYSSKQAVTTHYLNRFMKVNKLLLLGLVNIENEFNFLQLRKIEFSNSAFIDMSFNGSNIIHTNFENSLIYNCTMDKVEFSNSFFDSSEIENLIMRKSFFCSGLFAPRYINDCYFEDCRFEKTEFRIGGCHGTNTFINCTFDHTIFSADFENCKFINCHFKSVNSGKYLTSSYIFAVFENSVFSDECILTNSIFIGAEFRNTDRSGATFAKGALDEAIIID